MTYDILILGAGVAGLAAGRLLVEGGRQVAIVEARDRVGGRIATEHVSVGGALNSIPIELGAEFVHGLPRTSWQLIDEARLATYELGGDHLCYERGCLQACPESDWDPMSVLDDMTGWLAAQPPGTDATFANYLDIAGIERRRGEQAAAYVEGFNAADANVIGVAALAQQQRAENAIQGDRLFHIRAGYDAVPNFLRERFERAGGFVLTGKRVTHVRWSRSGVGVCGTDPQGATFEFQAKHAVITLPLGVLQSGSVEFQPPPRDILLHAGRMAVGAVLRVSLLFDSKFWIDAAISSRQNGAASRFGDFSFLFAREEAFPTWWTSKPDPAPLLTAWIGGRKALDLQRRMRAHPDPVAIRNECLSELARIFELSPQVLENRLISWHAHDWQSDEFARGAYSYAPAGARDASEHMTIPVDDRLFFAGEHTDVEGHWGTVHGALASGERAALQLMSARA
ncbi:MAG TPA: NAD(P)/FAD-dependent oxidoreductase [Steroidobacteraceae bacterium]|nr:NAD(P)/FAD-dependent oxidoreductase [Steroidobacteraceae bacterium]